VGQHFGVDVSSNNAHPIAWTSLATALVRLGGGDQPFVFVKITQGTTYVNPFASGDVAAARAAGFAVGGYLMDEGTADPGAEIALYDRTAAGLPVADDDELPDGLTSAEYAAHLAKLVALRAAPQYLNQSEVASGFPSGSGLWLAEYNGTPGSTSSPCLVHQYDDAATFPGVTGAFDADAWCGSDDAFFAFFHLPTPTPNPNPRGSSMISALYTTKPGQRDIFQAREGDLLHWWSVNGGQWLPEILAGPAGNGVATKTAVTFPDAVPEVAVVGGEITVSIEDVALNPWTFAQAISGPGSTSWGVNEIVAGASGAMTPADDERDRPIGNA